MSRLKYTYPVSLLMPHRRGKKRSAVSPRQRFHMNSWSITRIMAAMFYTCFTFAVVVFFCIVTSSFKLCFERSIMIIINEAANVAACDRAAGGTNESLRVV